jgi:type IV pilus assembly protein PilW
MQLNRRMGGFTLVELMIAMGLGLMLLAGLSIVFLNSSRSREEMERSNRQIENGRYAMHVLTEDLRLAGYLAEFDIQQTALAASPPALKPDACATAVADLIAALPMHIQGYDLGAGAPGCITDVRPGTDILVVRRAGSCINGAPRCDMPAGGPYFQAALCNNASELGHVDPANYYRLTTDLTLLDRHMRDCAATASQRRYLVRIYFIANNDLAGDGIPTLKRAELVGARFTVAPIAQGIENLQLEYGIDTSSDGAPDTFTADPDALNACAGVICNRNWTNTMAVKVAILARNTLATQNHVDDKSYVLGLKADGTDHVIAAARDGYKRHVYQAEVRINNAAGRRE